MYVKEDESWEWRMMNAPQNVLFGSAILVGDICD